MASDWVAVNRERILARGQSMFDAVPPPVIRVPEWGRLGIPIPSKRHQCVAVNLAAGQFAKDGSPKTVPLLIKENLTHLQRGVRRSAFCACGAERPISEHGAPLAPWQNKNLRREDAWSARPDWAGPFLGAAVALVAILLVSLLLAA